MADEDTTEQELSIDFTYLKSDALRLIKTDGIYGGLTPRGDILMSVFSERVPIPNSEKYEVTDDGKLGKLLNRQIDAKGIIRQVEVILSIRPDVAKAMIIWLNSKIDLFEKATEAKSDIKVDND